jgi:hypothetical protein
MRPSSLYRSDSRRQPQIEGNANNINEGVVKIYDKIILLFTTITLTKIVF